MSDLLPRLRAALADRYELLRELGAGGMATVYLARDVRHNRQVAVKVLHPELSAVLGPERFLKEIELTASLQHPHILPLFDSGEADGQLFYVMPFVEGETLRGRLDREKQLPIADVLTLAREAADALHYAHERGVIHRDIKPENILLQGGHALVADFGIALAVQQAGAARMTQTGLSLGTPQYMAPEQAMGEKTIDARADVYALGAVTYEMLTGEPPFTGSTSQAIVAKMMTTAPLPPSQTRPSVPAHVEQAVLTALEKLPADRCATAREFREQLANPAATTGARTVARTSAAPIRATGGRAARLAIAAGVVMALGAAYWMGTRAGGTAGGGSGEPTFATLSAGVDDAWEANGDAFAVSPNGRLIVVRSRRDSGTTLVLQSLDSVASRVLPNTGGATYPFFSPDNRSLAFFADGSLRVMDLASGAVITRCPAPRPSGGSWGANGVILYVPVSGEALHQTTAVDGPCTRLPVRLPPGSGWPRFLSDGRTFVFAMGTGSYIGALGEDSLALLVENPARAVVAGDELLYRNGADGMLVARHVDVAKRVLEGPATPVVAGVATPFSNTTVAASPAGTLVAYSRPRRGEGSSSMLVHVLPGDRLGSVTRNNGNWSVPEVSGNGAQVAMGGFTLELFDVARGEWRELVPRRPGGNMAAAGLAWLPGDSLVAFTRVVSPAVPESIQVAHVTTGAVQGLAAVPERNRRLKLSRWTADGRLLAVGLSSGDTSPWDEAWVYDAGTRTFTRAFAESKHVRSPELSPDASGSRIRWWKRTAARRCSSGRIPDPACRCR